MCEGLIYNGEHWMDKLSPAELAKKKKDPKWDAKFEGRWQKGMVVEAYEDGHYKVDPYPDNDVFRYFKMPGVPLKDIKHLLEGDDTEDLQAGNRRRKLLMTNGLVAVDKKIVMSKVADITTAAVVKK